MTGEAFETVSIVGVCSERPATRGSGGTEVRVALMRCKDWPDERPAAVSVQRFTVSDARGFETGVMDKDLKRSAKLNKTGAKDRIAKAQTYRGPTKLGWLEACEAEKLGYALLAAAEELRALEALEEVAV